MRRERAGTPLSVDIATMPGMEDDNPPLRIINFVNNPIIANSNSPALPAGELSASQGTRLVA